MNKRIAIGIAVMAMASAAFPAATIITAAGTGLWSAPATWNTGVVPGTTLLDTNVVRIGTSRIITLNSSVAQIVGNIQVGQGSAGTLIVNSGSSLTIGAADSINVGNTGVGTFTMNGGTVADTGAFTVSLSAGSGGSVATINSGNLTISKNLNVGKGANGSLSITGGSVLANVLNLGDAGNLFNGSAALTGGSIELNSAAGALTINGPSALTIGDTGVLIWGGNRTAAIDTFVTAGDIVWSSGSSTLGSIYGVGDRTWTNGIYFLHADYNNDPATGNDLKTRVWADTIPEPATIGMIGLGALITLLIRRFSGR